MEIIEILCIILFVFILISFIKPSQKSISEDFDYTLKNCINEKKQTKIKKCKNSNSCDTSYYNEVLDSVDDTYEPVNPCNMYNKTHPQSIKNFHTDFFNFRDYTYNDSNLVGANPVDKAVDAYLSINFNESDEFKGKSIMEIYDKITTNPTLNDKCDNRKIKFDDFNSSGYLVNPGAPGLSLVRTEWKYNNENVNNGGLFGTLTGYDTEFNSNIELSAYDKN